MATLTRCRGDPDADQETYLIHYDDIRVGSIVMRQGSTEPESSLLFGVASRLPEDRQVIRCGPRCLRYPVAVAMPQVNETDFTEYTAPLML